jgi:peptide/nickel transport system substrate-binding protein
LKEPNAPLHTNFVDKWGAWRPFPKHIFEKVEDTLKDWLKNFNLSMEINREPLKSYDPTATLRAAQYAREREYKEE